MPKNKISEFSSTPANNTDVGGIDIAEGCAPSGINNAIRTLMSDLKDWQAGLVATSNTDALAVAGGGTGSITATDARTNLSAAKSGANSDITSLSGLTTPITVAQGGTGFISQRTITTVGRATNVVTIVTSVAHGYVVNDIVTIAAVTNTSVNGTFTIASVPTSTSFTYAQTGTNYANTADTGTVNSSSYLVAGNISGVVSVSHGGSGASTLKANNLLVGNGTSVPLVIPAGTTGNVLTSTTTSTVNAGSFAIGTEYTIASLGTPTATDFTAIGASSNTVGVVFTATGVGAGNGTATTNTWASSIPATSITTTSGTAPYFGARAFASFSTVSYSNLSATATAASGTVTLTVSSHAYKVGHYIQVNATTQSGLFVVTAVTSTTIAYTGTLPTGTITIAQCSIYTGSQNVANVVYQLTGVFIINFTTPMPFVNYTAIGNAGTNNGVAFVSGDDNVLAFGASGFTGIRTTQSIRGFTSDYGGGPYQNASLNSVTVFA